MTRRLDLSGHEAERYAEAVVLLDMQASHIAQCNDLQLLVKGKLNPKLRAVSQHGRAYWHPSVGAWVRYSCGFSWRGNPSKSKRRGMALNTTLTSLAEMYKHFYSSRFVESLATRAHPTFATLKRDESDDTIEMRFRLYAPIVQPNAYGLLAVEPVDSKDDE